MNDENKQQPQTPPAESGSDVCSVAELFREVNEVKLRWCETAFSIVIREAMKILDDNVGDLDEFVMGMGTCFFTGTEMGVFDIQSWPDDADCDQVKMDSYGHIGYEDGFATEFFDLVHKLDDETGVLANPVRLKSGMKPVYDWGDTEKNPVVYEAA